MRPNHSFEPTATGKPVPAAQLKRYATLEGRAPMTERMTKTANRDATNSAPRIAPIDPPYPQDVQAEFDKLMRGAPPLLLFDDLAYLRALRCRIRVGCPHRNLRCQGAVDSCANPLHGVRQRRRYVLEPRRPVGDSPRRSTSRHKPSG